MAKVLPIKPKQVADEKAKNVPDAVFEAFNELIVEKWNGSSATVKQKEVVSRMIDKGLNQADIFDKGYLDVEDIYRKAGWKVEYDKPAYCETYDAYFTFSRPSGRNYDWLID